MQVGTPKLQPTTAQTGPRPADGASMDSPLGLPPVNRFDRDAIIRQIGQAAIAGRQTAVAYLRISSDPRDERLGVTRQRGDVPRLAADLGNLEVLMIFEDNDVSGDKERGDETNWARCVEFIRTYKPAFLLGTTLGRLGRRLGETEDLEEYCRKTGLTVWTVDEGDVFADAVWAIRAGLNKFEILQLRKRLKKAQTVRLAAGKDTGGGNRPYGFASDRMTIVPEEVRVLRFIARAVLWGHTGVKLARRLNDRGIPTTQNGQWTGGLVKAIANRPALDNATEQDIAKRVNELGESARSVARELVKAEVPTTRQALWDSKTVRRTVAKPRVAGLRLDSDGTLIKAAWPAILDRTTYDAVIRRLEATVTPDGGKKSVGRPVESLLGGMLRCALCMSPMVAQQSSDHRLTYRCVGAIKDGRRMPGKHVSRTRRAMDDYVTAEMLAALDQGEVQADIKELESQIDALELQITTVQIPMHDAEKAWRDKKLSTGQYIAARDGWVRELRGYNEERDRLMTLLDDTRTLRSAVARWDGWSTAERRTAIRARFELIIVNPAHSVGRGAMVIRPGEVDLIPRQIRTRVLA